MENEKIEIIQRDKSGPFFVRRTRTFFTAGPAFETAEKIDYLGYSGLFWFDAGYMLTHCAFSSIRKAEEAYGRYKESLIPPPPPKVIKVLKGE